jgi:hypothetical protein
MANHLFVAVLGLLLPICQIAGTTPQPKTPDSPSTKPSVPQIDLVYPAAGTIFDRTCEHFLKGGGAVRDSIAKAAELRPALQNDWDKEGRKYLEHVLHEIGAPFPYSEMQATLTVCPADTMSMPLLINVRRFLPGSQLVPPREDFPERLFHELMHHYVAFVHGSPLQGKYAAESPTTLYHLHVMALEKMVLTKFARTDELRFLDQEYRTEPPPGYYKRAWEIVCDIEGYEVFIGELKQAARDKR